MVTTSLPRFRANRELDRVCPRWSPPRRLQPPGRRQTRPKVRLQGEDACSWSPDRLPPRGTHVAVSFLFLSVISFLLPRFSL